MNVVLQIINGQILNTPTLLDDVHLETERKGVPGKLTFKVYRDDNLSITEGNPVKLIVDGTVMFYGFLFRTSESKDKIVTCTAYDQMRYLKNKDTYVFEALKASDIIQMISNDYGLRTGTIEDTLYTIPSRTEDGKTLLDMMQTALDITMTNTGKVYNLYDNAGKLTLTKIQNMTLDLLIDEETGETYSYTSSIDDETYNRIKLVYEDSETKERQVFISQDKTTQSQWGTLQYFESISDTQNAQYKADSMLKLYNHKTKHLTVSGCFGDNRVRGGSMVVVKLKVGDVELKNWMVVDRCVHKYKENEHRMDLTLIGGDFVA